MSIFSDLQLYISLFIIGLLGSTHCISMCGAIQQLFLDMSANLSRSIYCYNLGRVTSYIIIAFIAAFFINSFIQQTQGLLPWANILRIISGIIIILIGTNKLISLPVPSFITRFSQPMWAKIRKVASPFLPPKNLKQVFLVGMIWGWLPCSLVYTALATSLTAQSTLNTSIAMFFFGIGTFPLLIGFSSIGKKLKSNQQLQNVLATFLILIGLNILFNLI